jgi:Uma2 family endonuclease
MTTSAAIKTPIRESHADQCVAFRDIGWKGYVTLLRLRGDRSMPRMVYLDGTVWLMSPSFPHERLSKRLGWVVEVIVEELDIPCIPAGATTFRRQAKSGGVEGDQTYYLAHGARMRGREQLHLRRDPPPDLAIEAVHTHDTDAAVEVYRRFQVPEVWVCDEAEVVFLVLQPNGRYAASETSAAFRFLRAAEVSEWVHRPSTGNETEWVKGLRHWVRRTLKPRVRQQDQDAH